MNFSVSVIIPNYNGKKLLEENLPSVLSALKFSCDDCEIIVSDDASTDDSILFLKENYPGIKVLVSEQNSGFSATANRGINEATKELVLLLNSDVKLKEDYFESQLNYFEKPGCFGVMGSIYSPGGNLIDAAKYPKWSGSRVKSTLNFTLTDTPADFKIPTFFLSGANALMDTQKLKLLNGFNEIYSPFYMEDVDLSVRAWRMNWKCFYEPRSTCFHSVSNTINKHSTKEKVKIISRRNKFIFHEIHFAERRRWLWNKKVFVNLLFRWLILDFSYYKSYFAFRRQKKKTAKSKMEFEKLNPEKSLEQVVREIYESVESFSKKFF